MDRRILKTRGAIQKAFIELMSEKDFDQITINQISDRADLNRGTIYLHYVDKFDLLDKCMQDHFDKMDKICVPQDNASLPVTNTLLPAFEYMEAHFSFYTSMLTNRGLPVSFRDSMQQMIMRGILEQINMNGINKDSNKEILVRLMVSAIVGLFEWWIINNMPYPAKYMAEEAWNLLERNQITAEYRGVLA